MKITNKNIILFIHGVCQGSPIIQDKSIESIMIIEAANLAYNKIEMLNLCEFDIPRAGYSKMIEALELTDKTIRTKNLYKNQVGDGPKINVRREYNKTYRTEILRIIETLKESMKTINVQAQWN